jgi:adenylate cyclase
MLRFRVYNQREYQEFEHASGPIEFGRGAQRDNVARCVIQDLYVSKDHIRILELESGRIRIENLSQRNSIRLSDNSLIVTGGTREADVPIHLTVGETTLEIEKPRPDSGERLLQTIASPYSYKETGAQQSLLELGRTPAPETLTHWFETVIAVQRAAAGSPEFYNQTAQAVVSLVGLDRGLVLLRRDGVWKVQARSPEEGGRGREFSRTILQRVEKERRTFYQTVASAPSTSESLQGIEAVVAAPIFDPQDQIVGVVYGCRTHFGMHGALGIGPLEAQVMQLLASAVGVGLARVEQEAKAARLRVQFEQFFPGDLARELEQNPHLLDGQEREVTVLFSDIRGFTRLAERLGPTDSCRLAADVMERLTTAVHNHKGVVVHYAGDGLMAMWNAPKDQPNHPVLACRAALAMIAELPKLDESWHQRLGGPVRLGIGLNTGMALCGNTGSKQKFHYGALGHTVNLASRVEGATKQLGIPLLITGSTRAQIGDSFATRRLCQARLVGIDGATELYELHAEEASPEWLAWRTTYEKALSLYEASSLAEACATWLPLVLPTQERDGPTLTLLARATAALKEPPEHFNPVVELDHK